MTTASQRLAMALSGTLVLTERMFGLCMASAARELGFEWTDEERASPSAATLR